MCAVHISELLLWRAVFKMSPLPVLTVGARHFHSSPEEAELRSGGRREVSNYFDDMAKGAEK